MGHGLLTKILVGSSAAAIGLGAAPAGATVFTQAPARDAAITAAFTKGGLTLRLTARCERAVLLCPFRAEITAPPAPFQTIEGVDYTFVPGRRTSYAPITDAATGFRFEGEQTFGEKVYAQVELGGSSPGRVLLEGTIPFAAEATPPLPAGLRFEDKYERQWLEGDPSDYYLFQIRLRGDAPALRRIRSLEYRLPEAYFSNPRIAGRAATEYYVGGNAQRDQRFEIVAVIRWKDGTGSTHAIPFRPRCPEPGGKGGDRRQGRRDGG